MEKELNQEVVGHNMYKVVKKLKAIKQHMRNLNWKNGNLTEKVELCRDKLKAALKDMVKNPHNESIKANEAECLVEYLVTLNDEEKILFRKAKVEWTSSGDRNTNYFYKMISSKRNNNRIMSVCNEKRERFEESLVAEQFVNHFQKFPRPNKKGTDINTHNLFTTKICKDEALNMVINVFDKEIKKGNV
ncbi:hypothetical protein Tco_0902637 [Tanacetum coccineum]